MSNIVEVKYDPPVLPAMTAKSIAETTVVDSQDMYEYANAQMRRVKDQWAALEEQRKGMVEPLNQSKAKIQSFFKPVLDDLEAAEGVYKDRMLAFMQEQRRKQQEEQARNDEAARLERERLQEEAKKAAAEGHIEQAHVLEAVATVLTAPVATSTYVAPKGLGTQKKWVGVVNDKAKAIAAILANPAFLNLIEIDQAALNRLAVATKGALELEGIEFKQEEILTSRRAA